MIGTAQLNGPDWVFDVFVIAALLHILEEFVYPGGFLTLMRNQNRAFAPFITGRFAIVVNGSFLILCLAAAFLGSRQLVLSLSVAGLLLLNALIHIGAAIRLRRYTPGLATSVLLYVPLSVFAYAAFAAALAPLGALLSVALGVLWQMVPFGFLALSAHPAIFSKRVLPLVRIAIVFLLTAGILGNLVGWGLFMLVVDQLGWLDIAYRGHTLTTISPPGKVLTLCALTLTNLTVVMLAWRFLERKPFQSMLWSFKGGWGRALAFGLLAGVGEVVLVYAGLLGLGVVQVRWGVGTVAASSWLLVLGWFLASCVLAPLGEEAWYRGYVVQNVQRGWGLAAATAVSALLFGGLHLLNPNAAWLGAVNIMLSAVLFVLGMLWFRSLWFPIGWHAGWNFAQFFIVGLPNSGLSVDSLGLNGATVLASTLSGPAILTGGDFGLEASALKTLVLVGSLLLLIAWRSRQVRRAAYAAGE